MGYTSERNNQIVIELLKYHGIKKIVASPGATNVSFVASVQQDPFFELYSSVDERSAAYIACGMAEESGEPVVLSCTGATASRNYFPGLTEAFYRKLPILAITSTMPIGRIGHNIPQVIDRTVVSHDIAKKSVLIPLVKDTEDEWVCTVRANDAMLELFRGARGPVHMNVETAQGGTFDIKRILPVQPIDRIFEKDTFPEIKGKSIAVFIGAHSKWNETATAAIDSFCKKYNAVVIGDHTNNYKGDYSVPASLITNQDHKSPEYTNIDLLIHLGAISGAYLGIKPKQVWRVDPTGEICDTYRTLRYVFSMDETVFFSRYNKIGKGKNSVDYYEAWHKEYVRLVQNSPELPFSNLWIAQQTAEKLPAESVLHLGILNSLRSWNFFSIPKNVAVYCNTGGFGIDGCMSTILGASIASKDKLIYGVLGDLAFFYDMNSLGNRHVGNNIRLLVINNGRGQEFKNYKHRASQFGEETDKYIAAANHYGNKSSILIKNYVEALGFYYMTACNKKEYLERMDAFLSSEPSDRPIVFEVFTDTRDETEALKRILTINNSEDDNRKARLKDMLGEKNIKRIKKFIRR